MCLRKEHKAIGVADASRPEDHQREPMRYLGFKGAALVRKDQSGDSTPSRHSCSTSEYGL